MKLRQLHRLSPLALFLAVAPAALAQSEVIRPGTIEDIIIPASKSKAPYSVSGIGNEAVPYPYATRFIDFQIEGQPVRMAFMDVPARGTANGQTIVLLHGKNFGGDYWANAIDTLTTAGYRVVVPDQIGFGRSSKPAIAYSFDLLARNTIQLLDALKIETAIVMGHSTGGMLAVRMARDYPQRITRLVLENPVGLEDYRLKVPPQTTQAWFESEWKNTEPEKITAFYRNYFANPGTRFDYLAWPRIAVTRSGEYARWVQASALTYQMIYQQPVRYEFPLITQPTLLIIGQSDQTAIGKNLVSPEVAKTMGNYPELGKAAARDIPHTTLVELPNVGHIPHLEAPEKTFAALLSFLKTR